jgi:hypothetical protein
MRGTGQAGGWSARGPLARPTFSTSMCRLLPCAWPLPYWHLHARTVRLRLERSAQTGESTYRLPGFESTPTKAIRQGSAEVVGGDGTPGSDRCRGGPICEPARTADFCVVRTLKLSPGYLSMLNTHPVTFANAVG